jgi:hypothetical protein
MSVSSFKYLFKLSFFFILSFLFLFLFGCSASSTTLWQQEVKRGLPQGFRPMELQASSYRLAALLKGTTGNDLVVYLEGDGRAIRQGRPTLDPTPNIPQSYRLALQDTAPLILYLARLGQYIPKYAGKYYQAFWSNKRLAPEMVMATSKAIDGIKERTGASRLHLVGYSGGGGLALLLAIWRTDVVSLVTVAGLLDTDWWVENGGYRPLSGSLNPAWEALKLENLPQVHFYGEKDNIIPPQMSEHFFRGANYKNFKRVGLDSDHYRAWTSLWPTLLSVYVWPLRYQSGFRDFAELSPEINFSPRP